ncbi:TPA: VgrE protein [Escherichia coli]|nr:VgrE protein [Escherichia coli]HCO3863210.1 VgrE protein [Escherichia coli]HDX2993915.1 VgrE protein [Escherichia coli]HDX3034016.1 VgrE protein [Escherichia coli]
MPTTGAHRWKHKLSQQHPATHIHLEGESDVNGDAPVINWNCGATQPVPDAPVPKDLPPGMPDMRQF